MATITITRSLLQQGADDDLALISAFQRNSLEFSVERGSAVGTYATVMIGAFEFRAIKIATVGTTDSYIIDVSSILPNLIGDYPTNKSVTSSLIKTESVTIKAYDNTNTVIATSTSHQNIVLSFAYQGIGVGGGLNDIMKKGSSRAIYHNGNICLYNNGYNGVINLTINSIVGNYTLVNGYNNVSLNSDQKITGTLTSTDNPLLSIHLFYKPPYGEHEIAWLNRDGAWSFWNFRQVSSEIKVKKSNEVATYYQTNYQTISKSRIISAEKTVEYVFDTLAYNPEHFAQLCEIQESLAVIWNDKLMKVSGCNSLTAVCKQNLRFTLKLEIDENIAGY
jgi:hypothetical protein